MIKKFVNIFQNTFTFIYHCDIFKKINKRLGEQKMKLDLKATRRDLHKIPEIMFEEFETTLYLENILRNMGFSPFRVLETGILVFIDKGSNSTTAFRADIDALSQNEDTNVEFKSQKPGVMHACGHDGHMTMLLGFASYLSENIDSLNSNILLIFQPAEEGGAGAKRLLDEGLFKKYNVEKIFGIHMFPGLEQGTLGSIRGPFMAQNAEVFITIKGKSCHAAMPHLGIDPIVISASLIQKFQTIITRINSPFESSVITFGKINGGTALNVISDAVKLEGTIRTFSENSYNNMITMMKKMVEAEMLIHDTEIDIEIIHGYPAVVNDVELFELLQKVTPESQFNEFPEPFMLSEDFSYYQQQAKGLFYYLGCRNEKKGFIHPLHSSKFNFDEKTLEYGVQSYINISKELGIINEK